VARRGLGPISPEERGQVFTASGLARRAGEVDQEGKVFAPEQLGWGRLAVDGDFDRAKGAAYDHRSLRTLRLD
jgi:hypothetical protein